MLWPKASPLDFVPGRSFSTMRIIRVVQRFNNSSVYLNYQWQYSYLHYHCIDFVISYLQKSTINVCQFMSDLGQQLRCSSPDLDLYLNFSRCTNFNFNNLKTEKYLYRIVFSTTGHFRLRDPASRDVFGRVSKADQTNG